MLLQDDIGAPLSRALSSSYYESTVKVGLHAQFYLCKLACANLICANI